MRNIYTAPTTKVVGNDMKSDENYQFKQEVKSIMESFMN